MREPLLGGGSGELHAGSSDPMRPTAAWGRLTAYDDVLCVYRSADTSSDKRAEFAPRFGVGTPLYEHHTTSLVFSDPPLHTRCAAS
jgi:hypothetical protein